MRDWLGVLFVLLGGVFSAAVHSQTEQIFVDEGNPPFMYLEAGEVKGLYPCLVKAAFEKLGLKLEIEALPWKRALVNLENGKGGLAGIYKTAERLEKYDYSDPLFEEESLLFVREGERFEYKRLEDLQGKALAVIRGWSYGDAFDKARAAGMFKVFEDKSDLNNFHKLQLKMVDVVIALKQSGIEILKNTEFTNKIVSLESPLAVNVSYIAYSKKMHKTDFLEKLNVVLKQFKEQEDFHCKAQ